MTLMFALTAIAFAIALVKWRSKPADRVVELIPELRRASIAYAEKTFRSRKHTLVAKLDRAYRVGGTLHLIELKTRKWHRVYRSDIIELSAQRVALHDDTGEEVSDVAFVVTQVGRDRRAHRVRLLSSDEVLAIQRRRRDILRGTVTPDYAPRDGVCNGCALKEKCRPEARHHGRHRIE